MIDSEPIFVLYLGIMLGSLAGLWIASGWRDRRLRKSPPNRWIYRCSECLRFYESDERVDKLRCPICGRQNEPLKI